MGSPQTHRRLEQLYEISQLFASVEDIAQAFCPAVEIARKTLPLRSAILMKAEADRPRIIVWPTEGQDPKRIRAVMALVQTAYEGLVATKAPTVAAKAAIHDPGQAVSERVIVIPLVVAHRPPFGVLLVEGAQTLHPTDLNFVHAIANQLAIAFDRDRARRRDITRREHAEEGQTLAEIRGATSERGRITAERGRITAERGRITAELSSEKHEALAAENARLYEEAQRAVRGRDELLAIVSHDLRNPLWTILMAADAVEDGRDLPKSVDRIRRSAKRMVRLIEDLLDFASIEAGRLAMTRRPQDPGAMIRETLASFDSVAHDKGLTLAVEIEPHLPLVHCDGDRILQVFSNLVGNATQTTPSGGHIIVRGVARGSEVLFSVVDDGPGISEDNVRHLFERYWRSDDAAYKGTGLGLAIAGGIVSAHGGRIWAESTPGLGATFHFTIPMADVTFLFAVPASNEVDRLPGAET